MDGGTSQQNARYQDAAAAFGPALERLARAYEADPDERRDLLQDIHLGLWRSLEGFDGRCSMRTWVYRVAHNVAATHVRRGRRPGWRRRADLDEAAQAADGDDPERTVAERQTLERLFGLIRALGSPDREVLLLYLEDLDAAAIGEITGLTPGAVATRIHRLKAALARSFNPGGAP